MSRSKEEKALTKKALAQARHCDTSGSYSHWKREARFEGDSALRTFILQQYKLNFNQEPPADVHWKLLDAKNAYFIEMNEKRLAGRELSPKFLQNHKAAMEFNLQGFHPDMKALLELDIKHREIDPEKEQEMKVKKQKAVEKAQKTKAEKNANKGPRKGETWFNLFKANHAKKLTDPELAKAMTKAMDDGHVYTEQEVVKNRGFYNFGAFGKRFPKPAKALEQFKDEADEKEEKKPAAKSKKK